MKALNLIKKSFVSSFYVVRLREMKAYYSIQVLNMIASKAVLFPVVALISFFLIGRVFSVRSRLPERGQVLHNLAIFVYNVLGICLVNLFIYVLPVEAYSVFFRAGSGVQLWAFTSSFWVLSLIAFVIIDFSSFLVHYLSHRYLWDFHKVHHRPEEMTWLITDISHPFVYVLKFFFQVLLMAQLALPVDSIIFANFVRTFYTYFEHIDSGWEFKYGLQYIFVSPLRHRAHHAKRNYSTNYGFCFSFWDLMFGTFEIPKNAKELELGIEDKDYPNTFLAELAYPFRKKS